MLQDIPGCPRIHLFHFFRRISHAIVSALKTLSSISISHVLLGIKASECGAIMVGKEVPGQEVPEGLAQHDSTCSYDGDCLLQVDGS